MMTKGQHGIAGNSRVEQGIKFLLTLAIPFCSLLFLATPAVQGAFEDKGTGARGTALGDTYVVMGNDILSLAYNPAALARVRQKQVTSEYARLFAGLDDGSNLSQQYLAYGQPVAWGGTLAASWKQFSLDDLYKERVLSLGYGEWLTQDIAIGGALKQLHHSFGVPNIIVDNNGNVQSGTPDFYRQNGNANTAYSADLGFLYRRTDKQTFGLSILDINQPNVALSPTDHEIVPRTIRFGMSYARTRYLTLAGALQRREALSNQYDNTATAGVERTWMLGDGDHVTVRGSFAFGSREYKQLATGAGYGLGNLEFDYAFVFNVGGITLGDTSGTHRFSTSYRFGHMTPKSKGRTWTKRPRVRKLPSAYERKEPVMPRSLELEIIPEDIQETSTTLPIRATDISIDFIFDADFDGVSDDADQCKDTPAGVDVDVKGCAEHQLDRRGNPLPRKAIIDSITLEEVEMGRKNP